MITRILSYATPIVVILLMATYVSSINTINLPNQLAIGQTTGNMSSLSGLTSENIANLEIIRESINDAREDIHGNNSAEAIEELNTANKALARITNDTTSTS